MYVSGMITNYKSKTMYVAGMITNYKKLETK